MIASQEKSSYTLFSCLWELTLKCNLNCLHCGSMAGVAREKELTIDECHKVADEIIGLGCKELTFIGGEIFLFKGWEKIGRYLSDHGISVNLMSNGYRIREDQINQIIYAKLTNVGISLDGLELTHNTIRRRKDSFSEIINAFELLNKAGIPIGVVTSLLELNYPELEELYTLLIRNNVNLWQLQLVNPMGNMANKKELLITREKIPYLTEFIYEKNKDRYMLLVAGDNIGYFCDHEPYIRGRKTPVCYWEGCQAGLTSLFIDSVGNVKGCGALYDKAFIEGNVRRNSLNDIWRNEENFKYNRAFNVMDLAGNCKACEVKEVCRGGCRASNFFTSNSLFESTMCNSDTYKNSDLECYPH
jgi:radical SAM protein with 4Fe4S-binding SPASM domain